MDFSSVELVVSHDNCSDGLASALIVKEVLPKAKLEFIQYNTDAHRNLTPRPGVLFVDFSPHIPLVDNGGKKSPDNSVLQAWSESGSMILDHHKTAKNIVEAFGTNGVFGDEQSQPGVCGAYLAYQHVWARLAGHSARTKYGHDVERFARLAGIRDTWVRTSEDWGKACSQASILHFMPRDRWLSDSLYNHLSTWNDKYQWVGDVLEEKNRQRIEKAIRGAVRTTTPSGTRLVIFEGLSSTSDACDMLGSEADLIVGYGTFNESGRVKTVFSTRTAGNFNCSSLATMNGGGGHTKAAGFSVWEDEQPSWMHPIQRAIELVVKFEAVNAKD